MKYNYTTPSVIASRAGKEHRVKIVTPDTAETTITKGQLRTIFAGLRVWNCPALDLLSKEGRKTLHDAQSLVERLFNNYTTRYGGDCQWRKSIRQKKITRTYCRIISICE